MYLVRPADKVQLIVIQKPPQHVISEQMPYSPLVIFVPPLAFWVRVRPQDIAEHPRVGHVGGSIQRQYLLVSLQLGGDSSMHAQDLLFDNGGNRHGIETINEELPYLH